MLPCEAVDIQKLHIAFLHNPVIGYVM
jgi:hypothetical protein